LRRALGDRYTTIDLERDDVDLRANIAALPFDAGNFELIICNHVLEHVLDEAGALAELRRTISPAGRAVIMVPQEPWRRVTHEDPAIMGTADRERQFGQHDHVRAYGDDIAERLEAAGFAVEVVQVEQIADRRTVERLGLLPAERIYICRSAN